MLKMTDKDKLVFNVKVQMRIAVFNYFQSQLRSHATYILSLAVLILAIVEILIRLDPLGNLLIFGKLIVILLIAFIIYEMFKWLKYAEYTGISTYADPIFKQGDPPEYFDPNDHNLEHYMTYLLNGTEQRYSEDRKGIKRQLPKMTYEDVLTLDLKVQMRIAVFNYFQSQLRSHTAHTISIGVVILVILEILCRRNYQENLPIHLLVILFVLIIALAFFVYLLLRVIPRLFMYARCTDIITYAKPIFKRGKDPIYFNHTKHDPEHYMIYLLNGTRQWDSNKKTKM